MPCGDTSRAHRERGTWGWRGHDLWGEAGLSAGSGLLWWGCPHGCVSLTAEKGLDVI